VDCDSQIEYSVDKASYFAINSSTGVVMVWDRLDSSSPVEHVLQVSADRRRIVAGLTLIISLNHVYFLYMTRACCLCKPTNTNVKQFGFNSDQL